jgi:hypothetical protein
MRVTSVKYNSSGKTYRPENGMSLDAHRFCLMLRPPEKPPGIKWKISRRSAAMQSWQGVG